MACNESAPENEEPLTEPDRLTVMSCNDIKQTSPFYFYRSIPANETTEKDGNDAKDNLYWPLSLFMSNNCDSSSSKLSQSSQTSMAQEMNLKPNLNRHDILNNLKAGAFSRDIPIHKVQSHMTCNVKPPATKLICAKTKFNNSQSRFDIISKSFLNSSFQVEKLLHFSGQRTNPPIDFKSKWKDCTTSIVRNAEHAIIHHPSDRGIEHAIIDHPTVPGVEHSIIDHPIVCSSERAVFNHSIQPDVGPTIIDHPIIRGVEHTIIDHPIMRGVEHTIIDHPIKSSTELALINRPIEPSVKLEAVSTRIIDSALHSPLPINESVVSSQVIFSQDDTRRSLQIMHCRSLQSLSSLTCQLGSDAYPRTSALLLDVHHDAVSNRMRTQSWIFEDCADSFRRSDIADSPLTVGRPSADGDHQQKCIAVSNVGRKNASICQSDELLFEECAEFLPSVSEIEIHRTMGKCNIRTCETNLALNLTPGALSQEMNSKPLEIVSNSDEEDIFYEGYDYHLDAGESESIYDLVDESIHSSENVSPLRKNKSLSTIDLPSKPVNCLVLDEPIIVRCIDENTQQLKDMLVCSDDVYHNIASQQLGRAHHLQTLSLLLNRSKSHGGKPLHILLDTKSVVQSIDSEKEVRSILENLLATVSNTDDTPPEGKVNHERSKLIIRRLRRKKSRVALKRVNMEEIISSVFIKIFQSYSKLGGRLKSGAVITKTNSNYWLKEAGVVDDGLSLNTASDNFATFARSKLVLNVSDYVQYLIKIARRKRMIVMDLVKQLTLCKPPNSSHSKNPTARRPREESLGAPRRTCSLSNISP